MRDLAWRVGLEILDLPFEIQEKLTTLEKEYFKNHSVALKSYMGKVGIELNVVSPLSTILVFGYHNINLLDFSYWMDLMSNFLLIHFLKDMVPPKDPYIKVRILDDIDEGIVLSDKTTNFARHSMHFLKRTDAEPYIARVSLFVIPSLKTRML